MKALTFTASCRECGGPLAYIGSTGGSATSRCAYVTCPACTICWSVDVRMRPVEHRYPIGPLLATAGIPATGRECARIAGTSLRNWERWRTAGYIPQDAADRICVALGLHLDNVWPSDHQLAEVG